MGQTMLHFRSGPFANEFAPTGSKQPITLRLPPIYLKNEHQAVTQVRYYNGAHEPIRQKRLQMRHFLLISNPSGPTVRAERPCWKRSIRLKY
ncbi:hypothetical protein ALP94_101068 [Pseudomonas savastanoi pv. glycinea]|nr:hypothetical protein ALP94_101068 [Pseudomonas savastanoi pv. glycinea]